MNYLSDLYNAVQLYNTTHKEKANEVILGIQCYRFIKNRRSCLQKEEFLLIFITTLFAIALVITYVLSNFK